MGRGQGITCACVRGKAGMPPGHVQCKSARRVTATGAPPTQATPFPPTGSARAATVRAAAVRTGGGSATSASCLTANNTLPSRVPLKWGHQDKNASFKKLETTRRR
eukprot:scaffold109545_cov45-Phaeocystis_antarctica.AAC.1